MLRGRLLLPGGARGAMMRSRAPSVCEACVLRMQPCRWQFRHWCTHAVRGMDFVFARGNAVLGWFGVLLRATNERTEGGPLKRSTRSTR